MSVNSASNPPFGKQPGRLLDGYSGIEYQLGILGTKFNQIKKKPIQMRVSNYLWGLSLGQAKELCASLSLSIVEAERFEAEKKRIANENS